jgi:hypothetical protein
MHFVAFVAELINASTASISVFLVWKTRSLLLLLNGLLGLLISALVATLASGHVTGSCQGLPPWFPRSRPKQLLSRSHEHCWSADPCLIMVSWAIEVNGIAQIHDTDSVEVRYVGCRRESQDEECAEI